MTPKVYEVGIAIDFGMTGSAVTWNEASKPEDINTIEEWPGSSGAKVPTKISINQFKKSSSWGFLCDSSSIQTKELFKTFLDSAVFSSSEQTKFLGRRRENLMDVETWSYLYLHSLIQYAITSIGNALCQKFERAAHDIQLMMHCVLTTPTTWDMNTINKFGFIAEQAILEARKNHTYASSLKIIRVNITEPEAVANFMLHQKRVPLGPGDTFLVVDVGGATTDTCFCQVSEVLKHNPCSVFHHEARIRGIYSGCIDIDQTFQAHVMRRLKATNIPNHIDLALQMRDEFQQCKISYLGPQYNTDSVEITIPADSNISLPYAQIFQGKMKFPNFNVIFDEALISRLRMLMSEVLKFAPGPLKYLVLAGGGSHIPYIFNSLKHIAPVILVQDQAAVAQGCLIKWNMQLLRMTLTVRDTPVRKYAIGTSQRAAGEDVVTHTWRKNTTNRYTTVCYLVEQELYQDQSCQQWDIRIENASLALPPSREVNKLGDQRAQTIRVDLRLPNISPYVSPGDFTAYSADGTQVPCDAHLTSVPSLGW